MVQLDVVGEILYGELDKDIYLAQPEGFVNLGFPHHVWKLNSSLYGLKQSARQWHQCLCDHLKTIDFVSPQVNPSMYILKENGSITGTILVHVDDILLAGTDLTIARIEELLNNKFQLTQNEGVSHFLSSNITRNCITKTVSMNQSSYIHDTASIDCFSQGDIN